MGMNAMDFYIKNIKTTKKEEKSNFVEQMLSIQTEIDEHWKEFDRTYHRHIHAAMTLFRRGPPSYNAAADILPSIDLYDDKLPPSFHKLQSHLRRTTTTPTIHEMEQQQMDETDDDDDVGTKDIMSKKGAIALQALKFSITNLMQCLSQFSDCYVSHPF